MSSSLPRTLVHWWWLWLWVIRHHSAGQRWSHWKRSPCRLGSFIQSYWPWMTLWPSSMLSRIFDTASASTPKAHSGQSSQGQGAAA